MSTAAQIWRAYTTDGVSISGNHKPIKSEIRAWGTDIEAQLAATESLTLPSLVYNAVVDGGCDKTGSVANGAEVQAAIDAAVAAGLPCYFPAGTYLLGGTRIRVPSNAVVYGDGKYRTTFVRNVDTSQGTIEVFGASNVVLRGFGISYSPATFTLGYQQTAFCVRSGSSLVLLEDLAVVGKINRQFQIINASNVIMRNCHGVGGGNANLRIVSDNLANAYAGFTDEATTHGATRNLWIDKCIFSGATTLTGAVRATTSYGCNIASENVGADGVINVMVTDCVCRYQDLQGFESGGKCQAIKFRGCHAEDIISGGSTTGVGFLLQEYSAADAVRSSCEDCTASGCFIGFWLLTTSFQTLVNCRAYNGITGFDITATAYALLAGCLADTNSAGGFVIRTTSTSIVISGCLSVSNGTYGFWAEATSAGLVVGCRAIVNTTAQFTLLGTFITAGNQ